MKLNKLLILFFCTTFLIADGVLSTPPIGYEYIHSANHLHTWNQNPLGEDKANIWFNAYTDYLQFFNGVNRTDAMERMTWVKQVFGFAYERNGQVVFLNPDYLVYPQMNITTDNSTYWEQYLYRCMSQPIHTCMGWIRHQAVNDSYMLNSFNMRVYSPIRFRTPLYYVWAFTEINISNYTTPDYVLYCNMTSVIVPNGTHNNTERIEQCGRILISNPNEIWIHNLTQLHVLDSYTGLGHTLVWNYSLDAKLWFRNNNVGLVVPLGDLYGFTGRIKKDVYWIDSVYDEVQKQIPSDSSQDMSGYIQYIQTFGNYYVYTNTGMRTYANRLGTVEQRGYASFNISKIPKKAILKSVKLSLLVASTSSSSPVNWRSDAYVGTYQISDNGSLESSDWNDGTKTIQWDWSNYCPGNNPCSGIFPLDDKQGIGTSELYSAILNDSIDWYFVALRDNSLWDFSSSSWSVIYYGGSRCKLYVNYTIGYCDTGYYGNETWVINETTLCEHENITINHSIIINAELQLVDSNITQFRNPDLFLAQKKGVAINFSKNSKMVKAKN